MNGPDFSNVSSGSSTTAAPSNYGRTIPYALTPMEIANWLWAYGNRPGVANYLSTGQPPYGIIERAENQQAPGTQSDFLLYIPTIDGVADPENLRISVVTGMQVVEEVKKAPYKSPDDVGFFENLQRQIDDTLAGAGTVAKYALVALGLLVALQLLRK